MNLIIDPELEKCLPPLPEVQFQKLRASIEKKYDPAKPIVLWKERPNTIVDGHHRYRACLELGVEPTTVEESFQSLDEAVLYTLQRQIEQRNLSPAQLVVLYEQIIPYEEKIRLKREAVDTQLAGLKRGAESVPVRPPRRETGESREVAKEIAKRAGVSKSTVYAVHKAQKEGIPEVSKMLESGDLNAKSASLFVMKVPNKEHQAELIRKGGAQAVRDVATKHEYSLATKKEIRDDARKFDNFNKDVIAETTKARERIAAIRGSAHGGCLLPNVIELWCNDCKWGFDVYLPMPSNIAYCPYCKSERTIKRESDWNPREPKA
ncbi:hypothetical protein M0R72_20510 [Candidatus Pacearchaeota archaeon]|jgi:transposase|nr:hypothetical protein [Candidatus Pacearchaeota archaeon]